MRARIHRTATAALAALLACASGGALAQVDDAAMKAAYIYNFAAFTTWPTATAASPGEFLVCLHSRVEPSFQAELRRLEGKSVQGGTARVVTTAAAGDVARCRVLVLGVDGLGADPALRAALGGSGTLTVCECDDASGSVAIRMFREQSRLVFSIDRAAVDRAGLTISSKLLRLARNTP